MESQDTYNERYIAPESKHKSIKNTDLHKLCYFCEINHYKEFHRTITGSIYVHTKKGPVPIYFDEARDELLTDEIIKRSGKRSLTIGRHHMYQEYNMPIFKSRPYLDLEERRSIRRTINQLRGADLDEIISTDLPWKIAGEGQAINFDYVFYRNNPTFEDDIDE